MTGKLHRAKRIAKNLNSEVKRLTKKFLSTGFPATFIKNIIECFIWVKNDFVIPKYLFDERKLIIVRLPFSGWKKKSSQKRYKKLFIFTKHKCKFKLIGILELLGHSFKLKIMLNTTAVLFLIVIVSVVISTSVNPWELLYWNWLRMKTQISNLKQRNTWNIFLIINLNEKYRIGFLNTQGK